MSAHFQYLINYLIKVIYTCSGTLISAFPPHFPAPSLAPSYFLFIYAGDFIIYKFTGHMSDISL